MADRRKVLFFSVKRGSSLKFSTMRLHHYYCYTCKVPPYTCKTDDLTRVRT